MAVDIKQIYIACNDLCLLLRGPLRIKINVKQIK